MKAFTLVAFLTLVLAFAVAPANAQSGVFAPYVDAGVSVSSTFTGTGGFTASNPNYSAGFGIESSSRRLLLDLNGQFNTGNVRTFGNLSNASFKGSVNTSGYVKLGHLLVGGGARWSDQVVSGQLSGVVPSSINELVPYVGGGVQFSRDRFIVNYVLPGRTTALNQREFDFHNEIFLTRGGHFRLTQDVNPTTSIATTIGNTRVTGISAGVGLKLVL